MVDLVASCFLFLVARLSNLFLFGSGKKDEENRMQFIEFTLSISKTYLHENFHIQILGNSMLPLVTLVLAPGWHYVIN